MVPSVVDELAPVGPVATLFWSGAGISRWAPSNLPTGWELTERVHRSFFLPFTLDTVLAYHDLMGWRHGAVCPRQPVQRRLPRLETALGAAAHQDPSAVASVLVDVRTAAPNAAHRFFAAHVAAGGRHVTANFDRCIERAHAEMYGDPPAPDAVHHFHNVLPETGDAPTLGATLARIERGFDTDDAVALVDRLRAPTRAVVVLGYSASDFFDVNAVIRDLPAGGLGSLSVFWVSHSACRWHQPSPDPSVSVFGVEMDHDRGTEPPMAAHLRRAGATVTFVCGPTWEFLDQLAVRWGFAPVSAPVVERPRDIHVPFTDQQRQAATFMLYRATGLLPEVGRLLSERPPVADDEIQLTTSDLMWEEGRYTDLRRWWRRQPPSARRIERIGATWWAQGRLLPAYLWLTWHRRRSQAGSEHDLLAETEGRVIEHMARVPDLRTLGSRLARHSVGWLPAARRADGLHEFRRRTDLSSSLNHVAGRRERPETAATETQEWFAEAGNVHAALSYQHRWLRDSYRPDLTDAELRRRYREQQRRAELIGSVSARWRVLLLPGAGRVFTWREVRLGLLSIQFGHWHRLRLLVRLMHDRWRRGLGSPGSGAGDDAHQVL